MDLHETIYINYYTADDNRITTIVDKLSSTKRPIVIQQPAKTAFKDASQKRRHSFEQLQSQLENSDVSFSFVERDINPESDATPFEADPEDWTARHYTILGIFSVGTLLVLPLMMILNKLNSKTGNPRFIEIQNSVLRAVSYSGLFLDSEDAQADKERLRSAIKDVEESSGQKPVAVLEPEANI